MTTIKTNKSSILELNVKMNLSIKVLIVLKACHKQCCNEACSFTILPHWYNWFASTLVDFYIMAFSWLITWKMKKKNSDGAILLFRKYFFFIIHWKQILLEKKTKKLKEIQSTVLFGRIYRYLSTWSKLETKEDHSCKGR